MSSNQNTRNPTRKWILVLNGSSIPLFPAKSFVLMQIDDGFIRDEFSFQESLAISRRLISPSGLHSRNKGGAQGGKLDDLNFCNLEDKVESCK